MKPPFSLEQFLEVFKNYNEAVFPMQIVFYLISAVAVYLVIKPNLNSDKIINSILAFFYGCGWELFTISFFSLQ
ncbi:MAG: DUF6064 family protein [Chitinophagaceae bacterium]